MSRLGPLHLTRHTGTKHTATVLYFHGSGGTGESMKQWVDMVIKNFSFPHIKVLFPTAPVQPYTASQGQLSNVWFDRNYISINDKEVIASLNEIERDIRSLIKTENDAGIPSNRIVVGGFSMGGALAFHTGYRWDRNLAGVFAFSSFLNNESIVFKDLKDASGSLPPLLQLHGDIDEMVPLEWGQKTFEQLKTLGVKGDFHTLSRVGHSIDKRGTHIIKDWIEEKLPDIESSSKVKL